ncbi:hypothetical protein [Parasitella parasitica]|uniref:Uncharacterized protein n=1 Tax=Parasitella parasitica TaxID=35722 RepID=A0A0B7MY74_9FUNG|nr:hypothetical protein [Parasitella parasitica]
MSTNNVSSAAFYTNIQKSLRAQGKAIKSMSDTLDLLVKLMLPLIPVTETRGTILAEAHTSVTTDGRTVAPVSNQDLFGERTIEVIKANRARNLLSNVETEKDSNKQSLECLVRLYLNRTSRNSRQEDEFYAANDEDDGFASAGGAEANLDFLGDNAVLVGQVYSVWQSAFMWIEERKIKCSISNLRFHMCCQDGQAIFQPLHAFTDVISNLLRGNDAISKDFKNNIRTYNSALSFTSMNAKLDQRYTYSTLIPESDSRQIYIFDSDNELRNRMNVIENPDVNSAIMLNLQTMMHEVKSFVALFKTMEELSAEQPGGINDTRMIFRAEGTADARRYNSPSASEIGI